MISILFIPFLFDFILGAEFKYKEKKVVREITFSNDGNKCDGEVRQQAVGEVRR